MFPRNNMGHGYPHQMGGGFRFPQFQALNYNTGIAHPGMMYPVQTPRVPLISNLRVTAPLVQGDRGRSYSSMKGRKRERDRSKSPPDKKSKRDSDTASTSSSTAPITQENFIVPVSHGTEKITMAIWHYFLAYHMTDDDLRKKLQLRKSLHSVMTGAFPGARLFIVGSSMTGFATRSSDVDMCLMVSTSEIDQKRDATLLLNTLARSLKHCSFMRSAQVIRAKVPILKFFDTVSNVECDLNVNNTVGIRNTHLLRYYAYMDWRVRPLMLYIKRWARFHDINDASKQTVSSYSLTLMLIHYLQAGISPPVLPCLQQLRPDMFDARIDVRKLSLNFDNSVQFSSKNCATLGELFLGFLNYYSNIFSFDHQVISVRLGKTISRREVNDRDNPMQWKHLNIEEPFERSNTARSVYDLYVFKRVQRVFQVSFNVLQKTRDVNKILSRPF